MSAKWKPSSRERWVIALAPALVIGSYYFYSEAPDLAAQAAKQQKRVIAAQQPIPTPPPPPSLAKAQATLDLLKQQLADKQEKIASLQDRQLKLAIAKQKAAAKRDPAHLIEKMEAVFARNGITPLISEASAEGSTGNAPPAPLMDVLAPPKTQDEDSDPPRVWHYVFNDVTPRFQQSLDDLRQSLPQVVPLSFNLVYNPQDSGQTRLLELWVLY
jgi:hypothetical protein